jgi:hypothetical protein
VNQALMETSAGESSKNRRLGLALAVLVSLYIGAIIAFIIVY